MSLKSYRFVAQALLACLFAVCVYRAFTQSIVFDEALTWQLYIAGPIENIFHYFDANHHFLNTVLMRLSTGLFGVSEWSLRLPALAGAALYFTACYRLARAAFGDGFSMLLAVAVVTLNPFVLDFMVAARGYGLALALWMYAAAILLDAFSRRAFLPKQMATAGAAVALSVTANLVFILPAAALAGTALYLIRRGGSIAAAEAPQKIPQPPPRTRSARTKKKSAAALSPRKSGFPRWAGFVLPIALIGLLFFNLAPFESMRSKDFYTGAASISQSLRSLAASSLAHSGPLRNQPWVRRWSDLVALAIAPLAVAAGLVIGTLRRNVLLIVVSVAVVFSAAGCLALRLLLNWPYPEDRTGLYFLPLTSLVLVGLAYCLQADKRPLKLVSFALYALSAVFVVHFATEFNTRKFLVWEYDADTRSMGEYIAAHRPANQPVVRIGGSWQLQESLSFYMNLRNWSWMELRRETPVAGSDYYALIPQDRTAVEKRLGLHDVYRGPVSGSVLAQPIVAPPPPAP
ncbi:MAG TPA: glycosyltransferase family 39 protein [Bryobacteraceae bacterium]|nr:glycosyltransferase family 39 protein [Bryobacteraceae bacterium]